MAFILAATAIMAAITAITTTIAIIILIIVLIATAIAITAADMDITATAARLPCHPFRLDRFKPGEFNTPYSLAEFFVVLLGPI